MDKYVLVTGANGGIGVQIIKQLKDDFKIIALDIDNSNIVDENVIFIKCNVAQEEQIKRAFDEIKEITNNLYAIVNAIGIFKMQSIIEGSSKDFKLIFDINFFGVYLVNKIMYPLLSKGSRIINFSSEVAKHSPQPFEGYYNLSKITLDKYTDVLRRESNYLGIKVIKIQSGSMKTKLLNKASDDYDEMVAASEHFKEPLTKLKYMMDRELNKTNNPEIAAKLVKKILTVKKPKICYKLKNSLALSFIGNMPESWQDGIYLKVIK